MAIYHFSMQPISRSAGRTATAAAAYRAGCVIVDERTGEIHDYTRKGGVLSARLILPGGGATDRAAFWSRVEVHHKHPRAVTAREIVLALPRELSTEQRRDLAEQYGRDLADRYVDTGALTVPKLTSASSNSSRGSINVSRSLPVAQVDQAALRSNDFTSTPTYHRSTTWSRSTCMTSTGFFRTATRRE